MSGSWWLAALALFLFVAAAAGAWLVARRTPRRRQRRSIQRKMLFLLALGISFAIYALLIDSGQRRTTLYEVVLDGAPADAFADGAVFRRVLFQVEHPGVEHKLMIGPMHPPPTMKRANFEVRISATLAHDPSAPLISEEMVYKPRVRDTAWLPEHFAFTPQAAGLHTLTLRLHTPNTPAVHVRVEDPRKADGRRAPGY